MRELAQAVDREPSADTFDGIAGPFTDVLCRDRATRERVARMFAEHDGESAALVRFWTEFMADCGAGEAVQTVDEDLSEDVCRKLRHLHRQGIRHDELSRMRPDTFAYDVTFGAAVMVVHDAIRRSDPLSRDEAEYERQQIRSELDRALTLPEDSDGRMAVLLSVTTRADEKSWTDRAIAALTIEETLALCRSSESERITLGVEALNTTLLCNDVLRPAAIREALDRICVPAQEPYTLSEALHCWTSLQADRPQNDPPVELFLTSLHDPDTRVREAAASGLATIGEGPVQEQRVIAALTEALDSDSATEVKHSAANALAYILCSDEANTRAASEALARLVDANDPYLRAASVTGALLRDEPGAYDRLTTELGRPGVEAAFVAAAGTYVHSYNGDLPDGKGTELTRLLEQLKRDDQAEPAADDDRMKLADHALEALRSAAS